MASKRSPRRLVLIGWTSCLCVPSPLVSRRKAYILNQGTVVVSFFFPAVVIPAKGFGTVVSTVVKPLCPREFCGLRTANEVGGSAAKAVLYGASK